MYVTTHLSAGEARLATPVEGEWIAADTILNLEDCR